MLVTGLGVCRRLSHRFSWPLAFSVLFLVTPVAYSQKAQSNPVFPSANGPVDQTNQINERITELAIAATAKQGDYVIGDGDVLNIEVFDVPELTRDARVNESGYVSLPLIPVKIQAAGLTTFQFQDKVAELLQTNGLVSHPRSLLRSRSGTASPSPSSAL